MNSKINTIDIGISLADATLESYFSEKNQLRIKIKTWNAKIVEFIFFDPILFIDRGGNFIMNFCINESKTDFFNSSIQKTYEEIPLITPYKLFQFLDVGEEPYLEIICEKFTVIFF